MSSRARESRDIHTRVSEAITEQDKTFIADLKKFSGESNSEVGDTGATINSSPSAPAGNYIAREGDSMIGPLALGTAEGISADIDANNTLNVSPLDDNPHFNSNVELKDALTSNTLDIIAGAEFDGQLLLIRTGTAGDVTISQGTLANGGNIQTPSEEDVVVGDQQMIMLVFDANLNIEANTGGSWRVLSASGGASKGTGTFISADLTADQITNKSIGNHIEFDRNLPPTGADGLIILQTGAGQVNGIFELIGGKTYFLTAAIKALFAAANAVQIVWYDITNATELGRRAVYDSAALAMNQPKAEIIFSPQNDVTVELRIVDVTDEPNFTGIDAAQSFSSIYEFGVGKSSGTTGEGGPTTWKLPARAKSTEDIVDLNNVNVIFGGITLVQGDRILLTDQLTLSQNGLYAVGAVAAGFAPITRTEDFDTNEEILSETFVGIEEGTSKNQLWHLTSNNPLSIDISNQIWAQFGGIIGPNLGQDESGFDHTGSFVFDGRMAIGFDRLKRWESFYDEPLPDGILWDMIYLPSIPDYSPPFETIPGRLVASGLANSAGAAQNTSFTYSDDYNENWIRPPTGVQTLEYNYYRLAYDPSGNILIAVGRRLAGSVAGHVVKISTDRGVGWAGTAFPDDVGLGDVVWSESDSQFVAVTYLGTAAAIYTSPDGNAWTQRVTPVPSLGGWRFITYSELNGIYYCIGTGGSEVMTSPDGIIWTKLVVDTPFNSFGAFKLIYSDGHGILMLMNNTVGGYISEDGGLNWTNFTLPDSGVIRNFTLAPDLSLFVAMGSPSAGTTRLPIFWGSNDGKTWFQMPKNTIRIHHETGTEGGAVQTQYTAIVYAEEFGYFFGVGMSSNQTTSISYRFYRTAVSLNNNISFEQE